MSLVALATAYGGPEVLTVTDETVGEPGPGEARIAVRASGVNPIDYKSYSGAFGRDPSRLPLRLGSEAAGVVTAIGPDTAGPAGPLAVGDEVIAYRAPGAYAAELLVPAQALVPRPAELDWPEAAGLMLTGATAWHALAVTGVHEGDTVLVHGGAGGVGVMASQLAADRGARVVATASPAHHDLLRELGAEPVSYGNGLAERVRAAAPQGVHAAVDTVGTEEAIDVSLELVADPGTGIRQAARLELVQLARAKQLRVIVSQTFPLTEVAAAHRAAMTGHTRGKIALTMLARNPRCASRPRGGTSPAHRPLARAEARDPLGR